MIPLLQNPVYHSLRLNDHHLGFGTGNVLAFNEDVSPFAGFDHGSPQGFSDLYPLLPAGRAILYATPQLITPPKEWQLLAAVEGLQFLYEGPAVAEQPAFEPIPLTEAHVPQMLELAQLTKPGAIGLRTIEFGH